MRSFRKTYLIAVGLIIGPGLAFGQTMLEPDYPFKSSKQRAVVERHIKRLTYPTLTAPALVRAGGQLRLRLKAAKAPSGKVIASAAADRWQVFLGSGLAMRRVPVAQVQIKGDNVWLTAGLPADLARDLYTLRVVSTGIDETQPNAVRVVGRELKPKFRFAILSDHQLWDPSYKVRGREFSARAYPRASNTADNRAIANQGLAELALLDVDFVLYTGDLVFGLDYRAEYAEARKLLMSHRVPIFAVPGNHDGYAIYEVKLRADPMKVIAGGVRCRKHIRGNLDWSKLWAFTKCLYGDIKGLLYADLAQDGLVYWRRQLGPTDYAFTRGRFRFIGINTYAGTPERRHAFSFHMDAFDLHLGAPAVDNYGGYLTRKQLSFVERELAQARKGGITPVVFAHHDPRGNTSGPVYHANQPFPTDPIGVDHFEEWNFEGAWDSDPKDKRARESEQSNSATALLALLARYGGYFLCGHAHFDASTRYPTGARLGKFRVERPLQFIRTTSAASSIRGERSYWGYRVIEADGDKLGDADFARDVGLASLPAGNLWLGQAGDTKFQEKVVHSTLPRSVEVTLPWSLPFRPEGYRFRALPVGEQALNPKLKVAVQQLRLTEDKQRFWIGVKLDAAKYPPSAARSTGLRIRALPARGNRPPIPVVEVATHEQSRLRRARSDRVISVTVGQTVLFSAERSRDPDEDRLISAVWTFDDGQTIGGLRAARSYHKVGERSVRLTLIDEAGARQSTLHTLRVVLPRPPSSCGGCSTEREHGQAGALLVVCALAFLRLRRLRRKA